MQDNALKSFKRIRDEKKGIIEKELKCVRERVRSKRVKSKLTI